MGKYQVSQFKLKSPIQNAVQYTLLISLIYIIYKFANPSSPSGTAFISYIIPMVLTDVIFIAFPLLFVIFYFKDGSNMGQLKDSILKKDDPQIEEMNNRETLREYHKMLKEGIITQDEYNDIKKKYLKDLHKS